MSLLTRKQCWEINFNNAVCSVYCRQQKVFQRAFCLSCFISIFLQNFESPIRRAYDIEFDGEEAHQYSRQKETPTTVRQPRAETEKKAPPPVAKKPVRFKSKTPSANSEKQRSRSPPATYKRSKSPPATPRKVFPYYLLVITSKRNRVIFICWSLNGLSINRFGSQELYHHYYHQQSVLIITNHHQSLSVIISHHKLISSYDWNHNHSSSIIVNHHKWFIIMINHHQS